MSFETSPAIIDAVKYATDWLAREDNIIRKPSVAREIVKVSYDRYDKVKQTCRIAALSLLLMEGTVSPGNVAWLVRDLSIGFPENPDF